MKSLSSKKDDSGTTATNKAATTSTTRFGGSAKKSSTNVDTAAVTTTTTSTTTFRKPRTTKSINTTVTTSTSRSSEFTIRDAVVTPSSISKSNIDRDLLAEISFDDSVSKRDISIYETASSTNTSFNTSMYNSSPTRYPSSRHVSFDGSTISSSTGDDAGAVVSSTTAVTPVKKTNSSTRVSNTDSSGTRIVNFTPMSQSKHQQRKSSNSSSTELSSLPLNRRFSATDSNDDGSSRCSSAATVPTSNLILNQSSAYSSTNVNNNNNMTLINDGTASSVSSQSQAQQQHLLYDEFGVLKNPFESSSSLPIMDEIITTTTSTTKGTTNTNPFDNDGDDEDDDKNKSTNNQYTNTSTSNMNPFDTYSDTPMLAGTTISTIKNKSSNTSNSTNPFDNSNDGDDDTNLPTGAGALSSILEHSLSTNESDSKPKYEKVTSKTTTTPKKSTGSASWMSLVRSSGSNNFDESKEEKVDEYTYTNNDVAPVSPTSVIWQPKAKPFEMVNMYQDHNELVPVLFMVESKRQLWYKNEMDGIQRECQYYKKLLRDNVQEIVRVQDMIVLSYNGFVQYVNNLDDMIQDIYVNDSGELLNKREKVRLLKKKQDSEKDNNNDDYNMEHYTWYKPMIESFRTVQNEMKEQFPAIERCMYDVTEIKNEMIQRGKELEIKGNTLSLRIMEHAEENIQAAFDALMQVVDDIERGKVSSSNKAARNTTTTSGNGKDGILREFVDEVKVEDEMIHDRWLYESQYRYAAKLGLLSWKENRKDYEFWYAEVIALHEERKCRLNEVLTAFLSCRRELLLRSNIALMNGSETVQDTQVIQGKKMARTIEKDIERNVMKIVKNDSSITSDLTIESILSTTTSTSNGGKGKSGTALPMKYARSSTDLWKSALIQERRLIELKVNKDEWKVALCIVTIDEVMNIFIMNDDIVKDAPTSTATTSTASASTNPFESTVTATPSSSSKLLLEYYTKTMSTTVTTKVPPVEYSIKLIDYDISLIGGKDDTQKKSSIDNDKNPFGSSGQDNDMKAEIEFTRRARSMIFRKRDDMITIRVPTKKDAMKFMRNRVPPGERLAEI